MGKTVLVDMLELINHDHVDNSEVNGRQMFFFWFILSITVEYTMEDKYNVTLLLKVSCTVVGGRRWGAEFIHWMHSLRIYLVVHHNSFVVCFYSTTKNTPQKTCFTQSQVSVCAHGFSYTQVHKYRHTVCPTIIPFRQLCSNLGVTLIIIIAVISIALRVSTPCFCKISNNVFIKT